MLLVGAARRLLLLARQPSRSDRSRPPFHPPSSTARVVVPRLRRSGPAAPTAARRSAALSLPGHPRHSSTKTAARTAAEGPTPTPTARASSEHFYKPDEEPEILRQAAASTWSRGLLYGVCAVAATAYIGSNAAPLIGLGLAGGAVQLMGSRDDFLRKAGVRRVRSLLWFGEPAAKLVNEAGAVDALVQVASNPAFDKGTRRDALNTLQLLGASGEYGASALARCASLPKLFDILRGDEDVELRALAGQCLNAAGLVTNFGAK